MLVLILFCKPAHFPLYLLLVVGIFVAQMHPTDVVIDFLYTVAQIIIVLVIFIVIANFRAVVIGKQLAPPILIKPSAIPDL